MKALLYLAVAASAAIIYPSYGLAQGSGLCPGLRGQARTDCLVAERDRGRRETQRIERNNGRLDTTRDAVCIGTRSSIPGKVGGAIGDRIMGLDRPCTKRAR